MKRTLVVVVAFAIAAGSAPAHAGLLGYYPFDVDFRDASGNGNHLVVNPAAGPATITTAEGEHVVGGGALDANSTTADQQYLDLSTPVTFAADDAWSISFWVRRRPGSDIRQGMVIGNPANTTDFIWTPDNPTQVQGLRFRSSANTNANFGGFPDDGQWHHWAVVADGAGNVTAYRDNAPQGTVATTSGFSITSVGQAYNSPVQSMNGQIDELYIYDEAISAAKVGDLFAGGTGPDTTPPTLAGNDMVDDRGGGPVAVGAPVTYTLTFSEDIDDSTVEAADFGNAGTAAITIGSISEVSPGVFSVEVTPTSDGSLRLEVVAGAVLADPAGNLLDTTSAVAAATEITVEEGIGPAAVRRLRVVLIAGQSNAAGRGDPAGLPTSPVNLQQPQEDVSLWVGSNLTDLRPLSQFGPEITLGRRLADSLGGGGATRVAIIKYGVGGTDLQNDWRAGGDATTSGDGPNYVTFQQVVSAGLAALAGAYPGATIGFEGILWVQGERDAKTGFENEYGANLTAFIADVRATYGSDLPFIVSRLSIDQTDIPAAPLGVVRAAQAAVADADPRAALVDTDGFGVQPDRLHFDAAGQQQLGSAAAGQLLAFVPFASSPVLRPAGGGEIEITIGDTFEGFLYTLQTNPGLEPGGWTDAGSQTAADPPVTFLFTVPAGDNRRFFRVVRSLPP